MVAATLSTASFNDGVSTVNGTLVGTSVAGRLTRVIIGVDKSSGAWTAPHSAGWDKEGTGYVGASVSLAGFSRVADGSATDSAFATTLTARTGNGSNCLMQQYDVENAVLVDVTHGSTNDAIANNISVDAGPATEDGVVFVDWAIDSMGSLSGSEPTATNGYVQVGRSIDVANDAGFCSVVVFAKNVLKGDSTAVTLSHPSVSDNVAVRMVRYSTVPPAAPIEPKPGIVRRLFDAFDAKLESLWNYNVAITFSGGNMIVPATSGYPGANDDQDAFKLDDNGKSIDVGIAGLPNASPSGTAFMGLADGAGNSWDFGWRGGNLFLDRRLAGVSQPSQTIAYPTTTRWRVRRWGDNVEFQTTSDGTNYTTRFTRPASDFSQLTSLSLSLVAGNWDTAVTSPGSASFSSVYLTDDPLVEETVTFGTLTYEQTFAGTSLPPDFRAIDASDADYKVINNELHHYRATNVIINNGLTVRAETADPATNDGASYKSGKVSTKGLRMFGPYGKFVIRAKMNKGKGLWPAGWLMGLEEGDYWWPARGEIDIFEFVNQMITLYGTIHAGDGRLPPVYPTAENGGDESHWQIQREKAVGTAFVDTFHEYGVDWQEDLIRMFVDGVVYGSISRSQMPAGKDWPFNTNAMYLMLNLAVGGSWPGAPDGTTTFPAEMNVEWVRVYDSTTTATLPDPVTKTILIVGDSIADEGGDYIVQEYNELGQTEELTVVNKAVGGTFAAEAVPSTAPGYMSGGAYTNAMFTADLDALPAESMVGINWGTKDSWATSHSVYKANMKLLIDQVLNHPGNHIPIVPKIMWKYDVNGTNSAAQDAQVTGANTKINELYTEYGSSLVRGPDFYTYFKDKTTLYRDGLHLTSEGQRQWGEQYANVIADPNSTPQPAPTPPVLLSITEPEPNRMLVRWEPVPTGHVLDLYSQGNLVASGLTVSERLSPTVATNTSHTYTAKFRRTADNVESAFSNSLTYRTTGTVAGVTADAGENQTVDAVDTVTLHGAATGIGPFTWSWRQISGPLAPMSSSVIQEPVIERFPVGEAIFGLTVTDANGVQSTEDKVTITGVAGHPIAVNWHDALVNTRRYVNWKGNRV